jgi:hypothetical protein
MMLRTFGWSVAITAAVLAAAVLLGGGDAFFTVAVLALLEISLSFDNAVVNATVLERLSPFWQRLFLTVGIAVAVFGMRLIFPLLIVVATARIGPVHAVDLALNHGSEYGAKLEDAHPMIAAFGGMFLLMLFLDFVFTTRKRTWLTWVERPLARAGRLPQFSVVVCTVVLSMVSGWWADDPPGPPVDSSAPVAISGVLGIGAYVLIKGLGEKFEDRSTAGTGATGRAAFFLFVYLEVLDASFSFDGVIGAFAISSSLFVITAGLGIGALYIRSLTLYLVQKGTLAEYVYLEHGAHWAIGALAVAMLVGIPKEVPELVSGGTGALIILASLVSSIVHNRRSGRGRPGGRPAELELSRA